MGRKIIYGRSQGSGTDRPVEPSLRLSTKKGHGHVRILIPQCIGVEAGMKAHLWFSEEHVHFGVSFEEGGRLKVHGPSKGLGSLFIHGSVDNKSFEMLCDHQWEFSDVCYVKESVDSITFIGEEGKTPIHDPKPRKKAEA